MIAIINYVKNNLTDHTFEQVKQVFISPYNKKSKLICTIISDQIKSIIRVYLFVQEQPIK